MASFIFLLVSFIVMLLIVLSDNSRRMKQRADGLSKLIREVEGGEIKYRHDLLARLKKL